jgi:hypothetical protein
VTGPIQFQILESKTEDDSMDQDLKLTVKNEEIKCFNNEIFDFQH